VRLYLIGAGVIARTHAEAAKKLGGPVELRVADLNPTVLAEFLADFPEALAFGSAVAMLDSETAHAEDIVVVATPPFAHRDPTITALESGRHVLCEKPFAMNADEAESMLSAAEANGKLLGCCSTRFTGLRHTETVKRVLESGVLGEIFHVTFVNRWSRSRAGIEYQPASRWFLDSSKSGGGTLMDWGPYDISTINDIFRPESIEIVDAWSSRVKTTADPGDVVFDIETQVGASMYLKYATFGIRVSYVRASASHGEDFVRGEIEGTLGTLTWTPMDSSQPVHLRREINGVDVTEVVRSEPQSEYSIFEHPLVYFHAAVHGKPSRATVNGRAVDQFRWLRAIYDCESTGERQSVRMRA
jgi:predicted dehydrogenase